MALTFTTVEQSTHSSYVKCLAYGGPGIGKTTLAATLGPGTVMISAESGLLSIRKANLERMFGAGNPSICYNMPVITVGNTRDLIDAREWLYNSHEAKNFHSVAFDSISEMAEVVLHTAKRAVKDPRLAYGHMIETMEAEVRAFRDLPRKHVYMTAKLEQYKDELTGGFRYGPSMPGRKLGPALPYYFDEVFRLGVGKADNGAAYRFIQTQPDMQYDAKDRSGALASLEPPHLSTVFAKILGA